MKVALVTAVAGDYDHPRREKLPDGVSCFAFVDEASRDFAPDWIKLPLPPSDEHPRRRAKGPKLNPHRFPILRQFDVVVWVDGSITLRSETFIPEILDQLGPYGMVLSPHFDDRHDAYGEATIRPPKYADEPLDAQVAYYRSVGYPGETGLYECGVLARRMDDPRVAELGALWEQQVRDFSVQDQVSLPYCLWRLDYQPPVLPQSFREFGWVHVNAHAREEQ